MTSEEMRSVLRANPFRAFTIVYKTGKSFLVRTADDAWMPPGTTTKVFVADDKGGFDILDSTWIMSLSFENGASQRRAG